MGKPPKIGFWYYEICFEHITTEVYLLLATLSYIFITLFRDTPLAYRL